MAHITLTKVKDPTVSRWLQAVGSDYSVPRNAQIFWGWDNEGLGERVAIWVDTDGGGFGAIDADPDGYVRWHDAMRKGDLDATRAASETHPGVDECEFEPGSFDPAAETIELKVRSSFY
jgi:hypothetical protein